VEGDGVDGYGDGDGGSFVVARCWMEDSGYEQLASTCEYICTSTSIHA